MIFNCRCGTPLELDEDMFGEEIQCPRCRMTMFVGTPVAAAHQAPAQQAPAHLAQAYSAHPATVQPNKRSEPTVAPPHTSQLSFPPQPGLTSPPQAAPVTSANAIASLNLGINSFTVPFVLAIPSFLFGLLALRDCRKFRMQGKGMALAGMTLSVFSTLCMATVIYMAYPLIKQAINMRKGLPEGIDLDQLKKLQKGLDPDNLKDFDKLKDPKKQFSMVNDRLGEAPRCYRHLTPTGRSQGKNHQVTAANTRELFGVRESSRASRANRDLAMATKQWDAGPLLFSLIASFHEREPLSIRTQHLRGKGAVVVAV